MSRPIPGSSACRDSLLPTHQIPRLLLKWAESISTPRQERSVVGSYHKVSHKHLDAYLDELEWRFNNRNNPYLFRDTLLKLIQAENLPYGQLTA
ncbi:MAG: transposase [Dehalococcoidales bacterium]|nr:transposase [Dehalococcoidales bacterium]